MTAFQRFAVAGFVAGLAVTAALGPPLWVVAVLALCGVATSLVVVLATRVATGREALVALHHTIAVLAGSAAVLALLGRPVLADLDAVALGLGTMIAVGRLGCLRAGCCHGRPARWGVRYGREALDGTFPAHLAGVRLLPVPAFEAAALAAVVAAGVVMVRSGARPGVALAWFLAASSAARFGLEFLRGDARRREWRGLTEPQWTALLLVAGVAVCTGFAPVAVLLLAAAVALPRRLRWDHRDVDALAACLHASAAGRATLTTLPCGLLVSAQRTAGVAHLTVSAPGGEPVDARRLRRIRALARTLSPEPVEATVHGGAAATVHLVLR
jgi:hypothetical protein